MRLHPRALRRLALMCPLAVGPMVVVDDAAAQSTNNITIQLRNITTVLGAFVFDKTYTPAQPGQYNTTDAYAGEDVKSRMSAGIHGLTGSPFSSFAGVSVGVSGIDQAAVQSVASGSFTFTLPPRGNPKIQGGKLVLSYELVGEILGGDCFVSTVIVTNAEIAHTFVVKTGTATVNQVTGNWIFVPVDLTYDLPAGIDPTVAIGGSMSIGLNAVCNIPTAASGAADNVAAADGLIDITGFKILDSTGAQVQGFTMTTTAGANIPELVIPVEDPERMTIAVEFYNQAQDHYFLSSIFGEIHDLDAGVHPGWVRTGAGFDVFSRAATVAEEGLAKAAPTDGPVCRFYIPPEHGDSHFFSASVDECASVLQHSATDPNYSGFVYESPNAFYISLPNLATGACPPNTHPVYRLWNKRADSNHRYTDDPAIKAQMIAKGYVAEGYGPDQVIMCAPR